MRQSALRMAAALGCLLVVASFATAAPHRNIADQKLMELEEKARVQAQAAVQAREEYLNYERELSPDEVKRYFGIGGDPAAVQDKMYHDKDTAIGGDLAAVQEEDKLYSYYDYDTTDGIDEMKSNHTINFENTTTNPENTARVQNATTTPSLVTKPPDSDLKLEDQDWMGDNSTAKPLGGTAGGKVQSYHTNPYHAVDYADNSRNYEDVLTQQYISKPIQEEIKPYHVSEVSDIYALIPDLLSSETNTQSYEQRVEWMTKGGHHKGSTHEGGSGAGGHEGSSAGGHEGEPTSAPKKGDEGEPTSPPPESEPTSAPTNGEGTSPPKKGHEGEPTSPPPESEPTSAPTNGEGTSPPKKGHDGEPTSPPPESEPTSAPKKGGEGEGGENGGNKGEVGCPSHEAYVIAALPLDMFETKKGEGEGLIQHRNKSGEKKHDHDEKTPKKGQDQGQVSEDERYTPNAAALKLAKVIMDYMGQPQTSN